MKSCASSCPQGCFTPTDIGCSQVCVPDTCECEGVDEVVDSIAGKCVQQEQCTGKLEDLTNCNGMYIPGSVKLQNHIKVNS